jgi:hypothetical protein
MREEPIREETAVLAKDKGFNNGAEHLWGIYDDYIGLHHVDNYNHTNTKDQFSAPDQALLQMWLREIHKIHVEPMYDCIQNLYNCHFVVYYKGENNSPRWEEYTRFYHVNSHEKALEMGLVEGLKLIKIEKK